MTPSASTSDIEAFFDAFAEQNVEQHGKADRLLRYRVQLLMRHAGLRPSDVVLDVGCGNGHHLFALLGYFREGVGVDVSAGMIATANRALASRPDAPLTFHPDNAETLKTLADASFDVVFCIGALEHMIDKRSVLQSIRRVLRPGGRLVCLTLNGNYLWYRHLAPRLGIETRHLSTDRRLTAAEARQLLQDVGFEHAKMHPWSFVPAGDMPALWANLFHWLDLLGRALHIRSLRGGLILSAYCA